MMWMISDWFLMSGSTDICGRFMVGWFDVGMFLGLACQGSSGFLDILLLFIVYLSSNRIMCSY